MPHRLEGVADHLIDPTRGPEAGFEPLRKWFAVDPVPARDCHPTLPSQVIRHYAPIVLSRGVMRTLIRNQNDQRGQRSAQPRPARSLRFVAHAVILDGRGRPRIPAKSANRASRVGHGLSWTGAS
jgi:hypothetical protein